MKLATWMAKKRYDDEVVSAAVGVDRATISRIRRGKHKPSWPVMNQIMELTRRKVMPNDFVDDAS